MPDLIGEFEYEGKVIFEWFDVNKKSKIPNFEWQQVYMIGNLNNKVPLVIYSNKRDNLPGGKVEPGESIGQTITREAIEEVNMRVLSWEPLGYQKLTRPWDSTPTYQFRVYATLEKIDEFSNDPGGSVIGYKLVSLEKINRYIGYGKIGDRLVSSCRQFFN